MFFLKWCNSTHGKIRAKIQHVFHKIYLIKKNLYNFNVTKSDLFLWESYRGINSMFDKIKGMFLVPQSSGDSNFKLEYEIAKVPMLCS